MHGARARFIAKMAIVVLAITGCGSSNDHVFSTAFAPIDGKPIGSIDIAALPVTLEDLTGTVAGLGTSEVRLEDNELDLPRGAAQAIPNQPNAVRVLWMGGACEDGVQLRLEASGDDLIVGIRTTHPFSIIVVGCPALGVNRAVIIEFTGPVDAARVDVRTENEE